MNGWKTYVAAAIIGLTAVLSFFGHDAYSEVLYAIGAALGITGIRHKLERVKEG